jgi:predicted nucleotidyltransferase
VKIEYAVPRKKVETALQHYLKRISTQVKVHQVILFGSYAQDDYSPGSDIDIAIIAQGLPSDPGERFVMLKDTVRGLDLQPFAYTTKEWEKMLETNSSFASEIITHGKVLLSDQVELPHGRRPLLQEIEGSKTLSKEDWAERPSSNP